MTPILLAAITAIATALGGLLALKAKDRLHLVLGLSAGLLLGLVSFELIPEIFKMSSDEFLGAPTVSVALIAGFLLLHLYERFFGSHEPAESDYGHEHSHRANVAGGIGAVAMGIHIFIDGLALAIAFTVNDALGFAVFAALLVHAFSDGLNLVAFLIKNGKWSKKAVWLLGVDSLARVGGAAVGTSLTLSENLTSLYLAAFAGIIIYLATSHILPEAHARHSSRWTLVATIAGVLVMWGLVSQLHAVHIHSHAGHSVESDHEESDHDDGEKEEDHDHNE
ncbi:MAG: divalent heavy-metal cations transporter [Actinobacteria bacterium]|nr:divalent heavy-metal cations transporter [Actinomycetota bacterium]